MKVLKDNCLDKYMNIKENIPNKIIGLMPSYQEFNENNSQSYIASKKIGVKLILQKGIDLYNLEMTKQTELENKFSPELLNRIEEYATSLVLLIITEAFSQSFSHDWKIKHSQKFSSKNKTKKPSFNLQKTEECQRESSFLGFEISNCNSSLCWISDIPVTTLNSRSSKRSSLSFSHNSLVSSIPCDDSHYITGAVSHDLLVFPSGKNSYKKNKHINCIENDIYSLPVDTLRPYQGPILQPKVINKKGSQNQFNLQISHQFENGNKKHIISKKKDSNNKLKNNNKTNNHREKSMENNLLDSKRQKHDNNKYTLDVLHKSNSIENLNDLEGNRFSTRIKKCRTNHLKLCKIVPFSMRKSHKKTESPNSSINQKKESLSSNIRNTFLTLFHFKRNRRKDGTSVNAKNEFIDASQESFNAFDMNKWGKICPLPSVPPLQTNLENSAFKDHVSNVHQVNENLISPTIDNSETPEHQSNCISPTSLLPCFGHARTNSFDNQADKLGFSCESISEYFPTSLSFIGKPSTDISARALPPLPSPGENTVPFNDSWNYVKKDKDDEGWDFASIIEKVKNYGWYWGPISGEAAEKVLSNEPDGSFIVRDSSDYHYIFSLTFRLNGVTHHVRIEHDQGNFSFGGFTRFKSQTIVDFIEKAVEHSRSGRYLFFLHRKPILGPMRVQLLHPVSRFKHVQSLQHLCRFIIVKMVRKDLIPTLPLPQRLKDYLNSPHYYSEQVEHCMSSCALVLDSEAQRPQRSLNLSCQQSYRFQANSSRHQFHEFHTEDSTNINLRNSFPNNMNPCNNCTFPRDSSRLYSSQSSVEIVDGAVNHSNTLDKSKTLKSYFTNRNNTYSSSSRSSPASPFDYSA